MNFLISGGTGFIGSTLCCRLLEKKHNIVVISRRKKHVNGDIKYINTLNHLSTDDNFDVVINLAGEPIANKRWSKSQQQKIVQSRIDTTQELIKYLSTLKNKPSLFISSSAIGYYGVNSSDEAVTEANHGDTSFSSQLCEQWENSARQADSLGIRTCLLRTGIVLGMGGALKKMLIPFKLGIGGKVGTGKQWMSWIHIEDLIRIILYCINQKDLKGALNCTAPHPVTNALFTEALGTAIRRPTVFHIPTAVVAATMGKMGKELFLSGRKVLPLKLEQAGFQFKFKHIETALTDIL